MPEATLQLWADVENPVQAGEIARHLHDRILESDSAAKVRRVRTDAEGMDVGTALEVLVMAGTHLTVMGIIEGVRFVWERYKVPTKMKLPDGSVVEIHEPTKEVVDLLQRHLGAQPHGAGQ